MTGRSPLASESSSNGAASPETSLEPPLRHRGAHNSAARFTCLVRSHEVPSLRRRIQTPPPPWLSGGSIGHLHLGTSRPRLAGNRITSFTGRNYGSIRGACQWEFGAREFEAREFGAREFGAWGFDLPELLRAMAWRMSAWKADSSISSPSRMSIARRVFPSRLEMKRRAGSSRDAIGEGKLHDLLVGFASSDDAVVRLNWSAHPLSSTTSESAALMSWRILLRAGWAWLAPDLFAPLRFMPFEPPEAASWAFQYRTAWRTPRLIAASRRTSSSRHQPCGRWEFR